MCNLTLLATSRALLRAANDDLHVVRMLIDQGSELTFITEELVQRCKFRRSAASIPLIGVGGAFMGRTRGIVSIHLQSVYDSSSHCTVSAYILPRLMTRLPPVDAHCHTWPHVDGLQLADPDFGRSGPIHILLGSDFYGSIIMPGLARGDASLPVAQQTIFGWVLSGPVHADQFTSSPQVHHCSPDQELQELLTRFWKQEETPTAKDSPRNPEEEECEQHFLSTHRRDTSGRYIVRLPFKCDPSTLGESRTRAHGCLKQLSNRLSSDPVFKQLYVSFVNEYETLGHMARVALPDTDSSPVCYLPHHGILRPASSTTKLRVVFNGLSRTNNGVSLNDILHIGTKLQRDIADVLL